MVVFTIIYNILFSLTTLYDGICQYPTILALNDSLPYYICRPQKALRRSILRHTVAPPSESGVTPVASVRATSSVLPETRFFGSPARSEGTKSRGERKMTSEEIKEITNRAAEQLVAAL